MKYEIYREIKSSDDLSVFYFISAGPKGLIRKCIEFTPMDIPNYFNLAFGDVDENGELDDYKISNNGDRNKVLATVTFAVDIYLNKYPERYVYFRGSTEERTRLYKMAVSLNLNELSHKFDIYAEQPEGFVPFEKNILATGLLVRKKYINFE